MVQDYQDGNKPSVQLYLLDNDLVYVERGLQLSYHCIRYYGDNLWLGTAEVHSQVCAESGV